MGCQAERGAVLGIRPPIHGNINKLPKSHCFNLQPRCDKGGCYFLLKKMSRRGTKSFRCKKKTSVHASCASTLNGVEVFTHCFGNGCCGASFCSVYQNGLSKDSKIGFSRLDGFAESQPWLEPGEGAIVDCFCTDKRGESGGGGRKKDVEEEHDEEWSRTRRIAAVTGTRAKTRQVKTRWTSQLKQPAVQCMSDSIFSLVFQLQ